MNHAINQAAGRTPHQDSLSSGLVSVTFRALAPREIVDLAADAALDAIEWGGDIHALPGDLRGAREAAAMTHDRGLAVACYGSYYRAGAADGAAFDAVLATAQALDAPLIRVWAGVRGSDAVSERERDAIHADLRRVCADAAAEGVAIATELHDATLTDRLESTQRMLDACAEAGLRTLWQPIGPPDADRRASELDALLPRVANVHCFHWDGPDRRPLAEGRAPWAAYLAALRRSARPACILLEFVRDDSAEQFRKDADVLKSWLAQDGA